MLQAAGRGHAEAQYRVALRLLRDGHMEQASGPGEPRGEEPDVAAIRHLADAARQGHIEAARALDAAACRAPAMTEARAAQWREAVAAMAPLSLPVAMRIELAGALGLRIGELLFVDPVEACRGDCFVVDLRRAGIKLRRRVVLVESPAQREAAEKARSLFAVASPLSGDLSGDYVSRHGKFSRLCARAGIGLGLFRPRAASAYYLSET